MVAVTRFYCLLAGMSKINFMGILLTGLTVVFI